MVSKVLFIGMHNTRRSRFAQGLFNSLAKEHGLEWKSLSRGLRVYGTNQRIDPDLLSQLDDWGIEPTDIAASKLPLTVRDLMSAQRVILWADCIDQIRKQFPNWCAKVEAWDTGSTGLDSMPWLSSCVHDLIDEFAGQTLPRRRLGSVEPTQSINQDESAADKESQVSSVVGSSKQPPVEAIGSASQGADSLAQTVNTASAPGARNEFRSSESKSRAGHLVRSALGVAEIAADVAEAEPEFAQSSSVPLPRPVMAALRLRSR